MPRENEVWRAISATASFSLAVAPGKEKAGWTWCLSRRRVPQMHRGVEKHWDFQFSLSMHLSPWERGFLVELLSTT